MSTAAIKSAFEHLARRHPCLQGEAHSKYGRLHLPVSPACNIQCRFCQRDFNKEDDRPGVSRTVLKPAQAVQLVEKALALCPAITVVGIAGPGDALATKAALETFALVGRRFPSLIKCLSTNGLLLADRAADLAAVGVDTITVTINALQPAIIEQICAEVVVDGEHLRGRRAAERLIAAQLAGIEAAVRQGIVVKINTVLIPTVNGDEVGSIARAAAARGASLINIIPLIPQHEMADFQPPTCAELNATRAEAEPYLEVFRHCRQCRADAAGIPGGLDVTGQLYADLEPLTFSHG